MVVSGAVTRDSLPCAAVDYRDGQPKAQYTIQEDSGYIPMVKYMQLTHGGVTLKHSVAKLAPLW